MKTRTNQFLYRLTTISTGLLSLTLLTGCPGLEQLLEGSAFLEVEDTPFRIVGEDGNRMLFISNEIVRDPDTRFRLATPRDLRSADLLTLEVELVLPGITVLPGDIVTDGAWVAWVDRAEEMVNVHDLETGAQSTRFAGLLGQDWGFRVMQLSDGCLLVHSGGHSSSGESHEFVLLDLQSGEQTTISDSWRYGTYAWEGNLFAFMDDLPTEVEPVGLELTTNIQLVDLGTGGRELVAPNRRVGGGAFGLFFSNGQLVWGEYKSGSRKSRIQRYDPQTGNIDTLFDDFEVPYETRIVHGVRDERMLVECPASLESSLTNAAGPSLELWGFDGHVTTLVEAPDLRYKRYKFAFQPRFIGNFAVWTDPITGEFVIYDPESGTTRHFGPAAE